MKRPAFFNYVIGNPLVVLGLMGLTAYVLYLCWVTDLSWFAGVALIWITSWSVQAGDRLNEYQNWNREWHAMQGNPLPSRAAANRYLRRFFATVCLGLWLWYLYATRQEPDHATALIVTVLSLSLFAVAAIIRFVLRRRRAAKAQTAAAAQPIVSVSVAAPLVAVTPLSVAYRQLPDHCKRTLDASTQVPS